jgi:hypothetical protein
MALTTLPCATALACDGALLAPFIMSLINVSLSIDCFPVKFKHAVVLPLLKKEHFDASSDVNLMIGRYPIYRFF